MSGRTSADPSFGLGADAVPLTDVGSVQREADTGGYGWLGLIIARHSIASHPDGAPCGPNGAVRRFNLAASPIGSVSNLPQPQTLYRGSQKHKNRPTGERKGTLCPEWTHTAASGGYGNDPFAHSWEATTACQLFKGAVSQDSERRRYATARGIAFEAKPTADGTWHGYPVPWEAVPAEICQKWVEEGAVVRRDIRRYWRQDPDALRWAIEADSP